MKKKLTTREIVMIVVLVLLIVGALYYLLFYKPLQAELARVATQEQELQGEIDKTSIQLKKMTAMQEELTEIFASGKAVSEIAAYDNSQVVMNQLDGILAGSLHYSLSFADPVIADDGTVRRSVSLQFTSRDYEEAKAIVTALTESHWRCLITDVSMTADQESNDLMDGPVSVKGSVTFFESTKLSN